MISSKHYRLLHNSAFFSNRVRFAPSPTGHLHVGGLKTALINYLFAKSSNGTLIFRLEDTDKNRYDATSVEQIIKSLTWLGIEFDEGIEAGKPHRDYMQSNRLPHYHAAVEQLIRNEKAYHCFCSTRRLDFLRQEQNRRGENPGYDRKCLELTNKEVEEKLQQGSDFVVRLKVGDSNKVEFTDSVFGEISVPAIGMNTDPVILKSDKYPVYHLANVIDDHLMGITHVIRGQEWLVSTPKHIALYDAFGWNKPQFAHLPLIMKSDGHKVSKRDQDFQNSIYNVDFVIENGYSVATIISWLMSSGGGLTGEWHPTISLPELIEKFSLQRISTHNASLGDTILDVIGRSQLMSLALSPSYFDSFIQPYLTRRGINLKYEQFEEHFNCLKHRMTCLKDFEQFSYLWHYHPLTIEDLTPLMSENPLTVTAKESVIQLLDRFLYVVQSSDDCRGTVDNLYKGICSKASAMKCLRKLLINKLEGPRISELVGILDKSEIIRRINIVLANKRE